MMSKINTTVKRLALSTFLICTCGFFVFAGPTKAVASLDKYDDVFIGDWIKLSLQSEHSEDIEMQWPKFSEMIGGLEVIEVKELSKTVENGVVKEMQTILLTAYDSGYYEIPPIRFNYSNKTNNSKSAIQTEPLKVAVYLVETDMQAEIKDIKAPLEVPVLWREYIGLLIGGLIALVFLIALYFWWRKRNSQNLEEVKIVLPAHEVALSRLSKLEEDRLWQRGQVKQYYSELSDLLREYLENRYSIQALESTTEEIVTDLKQVHVGGKLRNKVSDVLMLSDLAKFAKAKPGIEQNNQVLADVDTFIRKTKQELILEEEAIAKAENPS